MIRIKDYIFNENEINYIWESNEKELYIQLKTDAEENVSNCKKIRNATFEDIEFKCEDRYIRKIAEENEKLYELEEENKKLKSAMQDTYDSANDTCGELQQRINKIKEYIKENEKSYGSLLDNEKIILKIIDGE